MAKSLSITVDVRQIDTLAADIQKARPDQLASQLIPAINQQVESAYELTRKQITRSTTLTDPYVQRKMQVTKATRNNPNAEIVAFGSKSFLTSLSHYNVEQKKEKVKNPARRDLKGNAALGIPVGMKAAGKYVEVTPGRRKLMPGAFSIPGKNDNDGNPIVFIRKKYTDAVKALSGPSVYQLFRAAASDQQDQIADDFENAVTRAAQEALEKVFE